MVPQVGIIRLCSSFIVKLNPSAHRELTAVLNGHQRALGLFSISISCPSSSPGSFVQIKGCRTSFCPVRQSTESMTRPCGSLDFTGRLIPGTERGQVAPLKRDRDSLSRMCLAGSDRVNSSHCLTSDSTSLPAQAQLPNCRIVLTSHESACTLYDLRGSRWNGR